MEDKKKIAFILIFVAFFILLITGGVLYFVLTSCQYNGGFYLNGASYKSDDGCNSCSCSMGKTVCTLMACDVDYGNVLPDNDEESDDIDTTQDEDSDSSDDIQTPPVEETNYLTYEDKYIRFEYPEEWTANVQSGIYTADPNLEGVQIIQLVNTAQNLAIRMSSLAGSGGYTYYDTITNEYNIGSPAGEPNITILTEDPSSLTVNKGDITLYWFNHIDTAISGQLAPSGKIYLYTGGINCSASDCSNFLFLNQKHSENNCYTLTTCTDPSLKALMFGINFNAASQSEFEEISAEINHFFDSIVAKDF